MARIEINFGSNGEGQIKFNGKGPYKCLGQKGRNYPRDITVNPIENPDHKKERHFSQEFNVWLEYAILIWGQKGIYIHKGADNIADNGGTDSAGCIHVNEPQVIELFNWLNGRTRILISYPWSPSA